MVIGKKIFNTNEFASWLIFFLFVSTSMAQDNEQVIPTLESTRNELSVILQNQWLPRKSSDPKDLEAVFRRMSLNQKLRNEIDRKIRSLSRYRLDSRWPDIYEKSFRSTFKDFEKRIKSELKEKEHELYRNKRMVYGLTNKSWHSIVRFDGPLVIEQLGIQKHQIKAIERKSKRIHKEFQEIVNKDVEIRMDYLNDCLAILTMEQKNKLNTEKVDIKKFVFNQKELSLVEAEQTDSSFNRLFWLKQIITPYAIGLNVNPNLPKLAANDLKKLKEANASMNRLLLNSKGNDFKSELDSIETQIQITISKSHWNLILKANLPRSFYSSSHPGIDFANYIAIEFLDLNEGQIKKTKAFRHDAATKIAKLRQEFCLLQDRAVRVALTCLERNQVARFEHWIGPEYKWNLDPKRVR